jgi:hypothetical protein
VVSNIEGRANQRGKPALTDFHGYAGSRSTAGGANRDRRAEPVSPMPSSVGKNRCAASITHGCLGVDCNIHFPHIGRISIFR